MSSAIDSHHRKTSRRAVIRIIGGGMIGPSLLFCRSGRAVAQSSEATYRGSVTTTILAGDGLGETEHSYQLDVIVVFGPPKSPPGGLAETNPFSLFIGPGDPNESGHAGHWEVHSAGVSGGSVVFQYWDLEQTDETSFTGVLTDPHTQESIAANLINVETPLIPGRPQLGVNTLPKAMGEGTQLTGSATQEQTVISLEGLTVDQFTHYSAQIEATRVA